jgi:endonuclease YncB( thermonuclease family)
MKIKLLALLFTFSFYISSAYGETISGRVVGVADGDTITVLDSTNTQHKIRLSGIDAPEKKQAFGAVSKKSLSDLIYDKEVQVEWHKQDRYGRIVGKVSINGVDVNLEQIKLGMSWFYKKYQNELVLDDRLAYLHAQETAETRKIGLWIDKQPIAPWDFRKQRKSEK